MRLRRSDEEEQILATLKWQDSSLLIFFLPPTFRRSSTSRSAWAPLPSSLVALRLLCASRLQGQRFRPKVESQAAPLGEEDEGETQEESGGGWSAIFSSPSSVKHPRQSWTQDELATLERLRKLGRSFAHIAKALGRSKSSVERQYYHHHTGHRIDWTDDLDKQRLTAAGKGAMLKQLGSLLGVSPMSAQRRLKKLRSDDDSE